MVVGWVGGNGGGGWWWGGGIGVVGCTKNLSAFGGEV